ncbi:hypothetical protein HW555_007558 [Spodoptera exigua]|uniref:Uncharacterized protein n=1 Tax=Spodoptera exigua TaxID=7107 RepID=A0A835GFZ6_SPOEX|nr:hypothetical protein HW555_007558 [Spodoptera exigua]
MDNDNLKMAAHCKFPFLPEKQKRNVLQNWDWYSRMSFDWSVGGYVRKMDGDWLGAFPTEWWGTDQNTCIVIVYRPRVFGDGYPISNKKELLKEKQFIDTMAITKFTITYYLVQNLNVDEMARGQR